MLVPRLCWATALPSGPMMSAEFDPVGRHRAAGRLDPGNARTSASSDAGIVAEPLVEPSTICLPSMTASVR